MEEDEWVETAARVYRRLNEDHGFESDTATELAEQVLEEIGKDRRTDTIQQGREDLRDTEGPEPATERQKEYLDDLGVEYEEDITKEEASELIDEATQEDEGL
ncbi:MAG: hypothetical protein ABEJ62_01970 [Candidatus Nanohaloarchaea archaeon]